MAKHSRPPGRIGRIGRHLIQHPFRYLLTVIGLEALFMVSFLYSDTLLQRFYTPVLILTQYPLQTVLLVVFTYTQFRVAFRRPVR